VPDVDLAGPGGVPVQDEFATQQFEAVGGQVRIIAWDKHRLGQGNEGKASASSLLSSGVLGTSHAFSAVDQRLPGRVRSQRTASLLYFPVEGRSLPVAPTRMRGGTVGPRGAAPGGTGDD